jgi:hypothetical protein
LTNPDNTNIINFDLWKQAAGGRHQIGTLAGFKSEQVAGFLLECMAGFVGIRSLSEWPLPTLLRRSDRPQEMAALQPIEKSSQRAYVFRSRWAGIGYRGQI